LALIACLIALGPFAPVAAAQEAKGKSVLIVSGELNRPYEILDGIVRVQSVTETIFANAFEDAIGKGIKELEKTAQKYGGDAVIHTSIQLSIYPAKTLSGEMGQVVIFGTLVKLTPGRAK